MSSNHLAGVNLNLLVALDALLQTRSVTHASRLLGVTQSAASRSLGQLRVLLDDPVLVRQGSKMVPTPRALALIGPLRDALDRLGLVLQVGVPFDPATSTRRFCVATSDVAAPTLLPALLQDWPAQAELTLRPLKTRALVSELERGTTDLALGPQLERSGLVCELLATLPFAVAMDARHPHAERFDLDAYADCRHVLVSPFDSDDTSVVGHALAGVGRSRSIAVRVPGFLAAPWALLGSGAVLTAPRPFLVEMARRLPLVVRQPPLELPPFRIHAIWHARWQADPAHRWLRSRVSHAVGEPGGDGFSARRRDGP